MKVKQRYFRSECPISAALDMIGDRWSLLIIRDMALRGKTSYKEFAEGTEKIATNILAHRLALLEASGIITKKPHAQNKVKIVYQLTQKGIDLVPILVDLILWTESYHGVDERTEQFANLVRMDREGVVGSIMKKLQPVE
ncbi:MAG TPA: helix-turn-helix domain-containing protein [Flavobacteriales bacterium]|nr:helix-turn-helix domain-containing protein [Flavobacteriales bacterium]